MTVCAYACPGIHFWTQVRRSQRWRMGQDGGENLRKTNTGRWRRKEGGKRWTLTWRPFILMHALMRTRNAIHHKSPIYTYWVQKGESWLREVKSGENTNGSLSSCYLVLALKGKLHIFIYVQMKKNWEFLHCMSNYSCFISVRITKVISIC